MLPAFHVYVMTTTTVPLGRIRAVASRVRKTLRGGHRCHRLLPRHADGARSFCRWVERIAAKPEFRSEPEPRAARRQATLEARRVRSGGCCTQWKSGASGGS
ncbi:hypothetical protein MRX96_046890 [Rhipicephalus microplus]